MKITELRVCDNCNGALTGSVNRGCPLFYVVDVQTEAVDARAVNVLGAMRTIVGDRLAAVMSPHGEEVSVDVGPPVRLLLCNDCFMRERNIALMVQDRNEAIERAEREAEEMKNPAPGSVMSNARELLKQGITHVNPDGTTNLDEEHEAQAEADAAAQAQEDEHNEQHREH